MLADGKSMREIAREEKVQHRAVYDSGSSPAGRQRHIRGSDKGSLPGMAPGRAQGEVPDGEKTGARRLQP